MVELVREFGEPLRGIRLGLRSRSFDDRALDSLFEMNRGNLRATDDVAFKSLDYAAAGGSWPHARGLGQRAHLHSRGGCDVGSARAGLGAHAAFGFLNAAPTARPTT